MAGRVRRVHRAASASSPVASSGWATQAENTGTPCHGLAGSSVHLLTTVPELQAKVNANITDPQSLAKSRQDGCFPTLQDINTWFSDATAKSKADNMVTTQSNFFTLTSIVTIGSTQFALYSLLHQEGDQRVRPIQRSFTAD